MAIVAGVDFGTLSVRVSIVDSERSLLATSLAEYPLHRKRELDAARHIYKQVGFRVVRKKRHHSFSKDLVAKTWELSL